MVTVSLVTPGVFAAVVPPPLLLPVPQALASSASAMPAASGPVTVQRARCGLLIVRPFSIRAVIAPGGCPAREARSAAAAGPADLVGEPAEGALDAGRGDQHHHDQ